MRVDELRALIAAATCAPGYQVTRDGRVFSTASNWRGYGARELQQTSNSHGYARVRMMIDGRRKSPVVHKLVAAAFLEPRPSARHQIRHLNGNRMDPSADNLAWGTAKDNADDRAAHGTTARGERSGCSKLTRDDVATIRSLSRDGVSNRKIARQIGVANSTIDRVVSGHSWRGL